MTTKQETSNASTPTKQINGELKQGMLQSFKLIVLYNNSL